MIYLLLDLEIEIILTSFASLIINVSNDTIEKVMKNLSTLLSRGRIRSNYWPGKTLKSMSIYLFLMRTNDWPLVESESIEIVIFNEAEFQADSGLFWLKNKPPLRDEKQRTSVQSLPIIYLIIFLFY